MTKVYPSIERDDLILLQGIASYMIFAYGAVYVISRCFVKSPHDGSS